MSDIIIKGIEMPKTCRRCIEIGISVKCRVIEQEPVTAAMVGYNRPEDCPLKELPPHGKLKDTDVIINTIRKATKDAFGKGDTLRYGYLSDIIDMIEKAPTVLEASK